MQPWAQPDSGPAAPGAGPATAGPRTGVVRPEAPPDARHALRPLATFEIVDQATVFWRRYVGTVVAVTLLLTLPVQVASALTCRTGRPCAGVSPSLWGATAGLDSGAAGAGVTLLLALAAVLAGQVAAAAVAHLVTADRLGNDLTTGAALRLAVRQSPKVAVAWVLGHLLLVVSAVTVIGPVIVAPLLLVVTPVVAIERAGPVAGLRRSMRLGRTRYWPVLGVYLASGLVATLLGLAFSALPLAFTLYGPLGAWSWLFEAAAAQLQVLVTVPTTAAAATLAYLDLRVRAEGLDLHLDAGRAFAPPVVVGEERRALAG